MRKSTVANSAILVGSGPILYGYKHSRGFLMAANGNDQPGAAPAGLTQRLPGARSALILLLSINLFNYIDRQVLAAVLPNIEIDFLNDDPDAKTKLGLLTTAFLVAYMAFS